MCFYALIYLVALEEPIFQTELVFTIAPGTASTVVGLTSGRFLLISALESGARLLRTAASTLVSLPHSHYTIKLLLLIVLDSFFIPARFSLYGSMYANA